MDFARPIPLPNGIFTSTSAVYDEVASYSTIPPDRVRKYWHVYTTTHKKLHDPTARRLENFWWHVWGSDRSKLSGRVLARIFEEISLGPTVVPLNRPSNRYGPDVCPLTIDTIVAHLQNNALFKSESATVLTNRNDQKSSVASSRPAQLPPILKKIGRPSTSLARNTARFVSLHESAEEDRQESDLSSSGSTLADGFDATEHVVLRTPTHSQSKAATGNLLFPTSTSARAPDPSAVGDTGAATASLPEEDEDTRQCNSVVNTASRSPALSKAQTSHGSQFIERKPSMGTSNHDKILLSKQPVNRSHTNNSLDVAQEPFTQRPNLSLFATATASTTYAAVRGTIIDQAGSNRDLLQLSASHPIKTDEPGPRGESSTSSLLKSRLTPTQPSISTVLPWVVPKVN